MGSNILHAFEARYRGDHVREHALLLDAQGNVVTQNAGDNDSVHFTDSDLEAAQGGFITHSHPKGLPPSSADLLLAAKYGLLLRAVGNAPDTGQQVNYTVKFPSDLSKGIAAHFDNAVEQAEKELAQLPCSDLEWQRASRHLAVTRLSQALGFTYQRVYKSVSLSEATTHEKVRLDLLGNIQTALEIGRASCMERV